MKARIILLYFTWFSFLLIVSCSFTFFFLYNKKSLVFGEYEKFELNYGYNWIHAWSARPNFFFNAFLMDEINFRKYEFHLPFEFTKRWTNLTSLHQTVYVMVSNDPTTPYDLVFENICSERVIEVHVKYFFITATIAVWGALFLIPSFITIIIMIRKHVLSRNLTIEELLHRREKENLLTQLKLKKYNTIIAIQEMAKWKNQNQNDQEIPFSQSSSSLCSFPRSSSSLSSISSISS